MSDAQNSILSTRPSVTMTQKIPENQAGNGAVQQIGATPPSGFATSLGHWIHNHRGVSHGPLTFVPYEFVRAAAASVPYGFGMAFWHHAFTATKNLTAGMEEVEGLKGVLGRNTHRFASSPMNAVFQIATGFTMYRFTGGLVKAMRNKYFDEDPNKTEAETIADVQNFWGNVKQHTHVNWAPEMGSTPWGALVLGFGTANVPAFAGVYKEVTGEAGKALSWFGKGGKLDKLWLQPKAKLIQNAGVFSIAYSTFFEMSERLFKDVQIRRGVHNGYPNSTIRSESDSVGAPIGTTEQQAEASFGAAVAERLEGKENPTTTIQAPQHVERTKHGMGDDPSIRRLVMRQLVPTAIGISAYAAMKRVGYTMVGGPMEEVTKEVLGSGVGNNVKHFLKNSWKEGAATSMFFTLWAAHDIWKPNYDKMVAKANEENGVMPEKTKRNYDALLKQLDQKLEAEKGTGTPSV